MNRSPASAVLSCCLLVWALCSHAAEPVANVFDVQRLMQLLSMAPEAEVAYTEKKYSKLLDQPLQSSGTLAFRRPDTVEKNMKLPRSESYRIVGEELLVIRKGAEKRYPLSSQPLLGAFAASLRGVLTGDAALLGRHYRLSLEGEERAWRLDLKPLDGNIGRFVERIQVSGHAGRIDQIEVRESNGDRALTQITMPAATP